MSQVNVSVVMATYNSIDFLESFFSNFLRINREGLELIVVDGGSTDGTYNYISKSPFVSKFISEPDLGIYDAMNKGVKLSSGKYVFFLGCDDIILPSFSDFCMSVKFESELSNNIYYGNVLMSHRGFVAFGKFDRYKLVVKNIPHQAILYPRHILLDNRYDIRFRNYADYALNIRLWSSSVKFIYKNLVVSVFNETGASVNGDPDFQKIKGMYILKFLGFDVYMFYIARCLAVSFKSNFSKLLSKVL